MKKILLGNEAIVQGALEAGVDFVSGYPVCPSSEIGDEFLKLSRLQSNRGSTMTTTAVGASGQKENGVYSEWSTNEKVALEAAIGASFSGLKSLVNMKSFGINVCSDSLFPLAYTGTKAGMVIVVADDPSCWSSAQSEQDSRGYAYLSRIPMVEPADPQEAYEFTKLAYEISEKFNTPVILRITTRVAHQRMPVQFEGVKIEKIKQFAEKSKLNKIVGCRTYHNLGIIASGVAYLHVKEALEEMNLDLPVFKLGLFYPLPEKKIKFALSKILRIKYKKPIIVNSDLPRRHPQLCSGCPYWPAFSSIKKFSPEGTIFGGD